ncbi:MAG: LysR family transcriptional regulator [Paracoccaceae bacterium]|nr:LysR family transcriptional regulator [Paracoccaceae bacterium]
MADALHRTQPAVTSRKRSIEETFGTELSERTGSGVRLTKQ